MARYRGPKSRIERKYNEPIFGSGKVLEKKNYRPGQHGQGRSRMSEHGAQQHDKQKPKYIYQLLEKQFKRQVRIAVKKGFGILQILERRLDSVAFRAGFAKTRRQARQNVSHKHFKVNGKPVNIASYLLKPGDIVSVREKSKPIITQQGAFKSREKQYPWLTWHVQNMEVTFFQLPEVEQIPEKINQQSIIEMYSK